MLGRELGRGATGRVYVAEDTVLARPVAIKLISSLDPASRQRFLLEARAVARIHHPNVVGIYRIGTYQHRPYFVTELVRGTTLAELSKPVAPEVALDIAIGVARGLAAAHRRNVVHCDLKPSNVMIDIDGQAKIIDFGLARFAAEGNSAVHLPVGTPDYMAPEVWAGEAPSRRADVYSLGAVMFELLSGAPPFADVPPGELRDRVTSSDAPGLRDRAPGVDARLAAIVARCLRRDRAARYPDADELRDALEQLHATGRHAAPRRRDENPYRGLRPFEASHRGVFFGRRLEIDAVVARLRSEPIVLITGESGVGKSSLCRAGVVPAVVDGALDTLLPEPAEASRGWTAVTIVPGTRPLTALATALGALPSELLEAPAQLIRALRRRAGDRGLIVFIDQLEELITLGEPGEVAALDAGLAGLYDAVPGLRLLATVRADFLARISTLPGLGRDLSRLLYFLRPLPAERLRDVIVGPALAAGVRFEPEQIVDELAAAAAQAGSGALPLLSFALADLWEARDPGGVISGAAVAAMGGVTGALSRHADVVIGVMLPDVRAHARRLLLRLVSAMGTRARRAGPELELGAAARAALDALVTGRLVIAHHGDGEPTYELAHECLLTDWPSMRQWIDEDAVDRVVRERLAQAAAEWARLGRNSDTTWQGARLAEALALDPETLGAVERAFVRASQRTARRRKLLLGLAIAGAFGIAAGAFLTHRYLARHELAVEVANELAVARTSAAQADLAEAAHSRHAELAFADFDRKDWDRGEDEWKQASAASKLAEHDYSDANQHADSAYAKNRWSDGARELLGDVLTKRATLAERSQDLHRRDDLIERLAASDLDGTRRQQWDQPSTLLVGAPDGARLELAPVDRDAAEKPLPVISISAVGPVAPGDYILEVTAPGRVPLRVPLLIDRHATVKVDAAAPLVGAVPPGMIFIPPGDFLYGAANEDERTMLYDTAPLHRRRTDAYLIGRYEVTFAEWLTYVEAQPAARRAQLLPSAPACENSMRITPDGVHWRFAISLAGRRYTAG